MAALTQLGWGAGQDRLYKLRLKGCDHRKPVKLVKDGSDMCRFVIICKGSSSRVLHHLKAMYSFGG